MQLPKDSCHQACLSQWRMTKKIVASDNLNKLNYSILKIDLITNEQKSNFRFLIWMLKFELCYFIAFILMELQNLIHPFSKHTVSLLGTCGCWSLSQSRGSHRMVCQSITETKKTQHCEKSEAYLCWFATYFIYLRARKNVFNGMIY